MSKNKKMSIILLLSLISAIFTISSGLLATQTEARTEEVLDTANNNLKISMQAPDDWNSGKLSATFLNLDWKLNGIFATNFATKLFSSSEESIALFAIVNAPSIANAAIPLAQKFGLISFALSQFVTINKESDITLSDGSPGHSYSISASVEQLRKLKAPIDKALDAVLVTTQQQDKTYIVVYATEAGRMSQYQSVFDSILNSVTVGTASLSGSGNQASGSINPNTPSQTSPPSEPIEPSVKSNVPPPSASQFSAKLSGGNEVPPADSEASAIATFSVDNDLISYKIEVSGMDNVLRAFLQNAKEGANGDVVAVLDTDKLVEGTITAADLVGPLKGKSVSDFVDLIKKGKIYVNLHSPDFEDGEIRGQVK